MSDRRLPLDEELRVRRERLAELWAQDWDRPSRSEGEVDKFWSNVERLLADRKELAEDAASMEAYDKLEELRARRIAAETESISDWLDK
jgi:hypothetical protein